MKNSSQATNEPKFKIDKIIISKITQLDTDKTSFIFEVKKDQKAFFRKKEALLAFQEWLGKE